MKQTTEEVKSIVVSAQEFGLDEVKVKAIADKFIPVVNIMTEYEAEFQEVIKLDINEPATALRASTLRKKYAKVRTATGHLHKQEKADSLALGRYIDKWKNEQEKASERIETTLENIEKHTENLEKERIAKLQAERETEVSQFGVENVSELKLGEMSNEVYEAFVYGNQKKFEEKKELEAKLEAERIEKERLDAEQREKDRLENIRLKEEADKREAEIKKEREAQEKLLAEERAKAQKEKEAAEKEAKRIADETAKREAEAKAKADAEQKKMREEAQAKIEAEKKERERVEAELKAKQEEEARVNREAEEREQAELAKGDSDKVKDLISDLESLKTKYVFKSAKSAKAYAEVGMLLDKVIAHINK